MNGRSPWSSIWLKPRETIQSIIDQDPERSVILLASLSGVSQALDKAAAKSSGDTLSLPVIFGLAAVAGPISGMIGLYIGGFLLKHAGHWLGGSGNGVNVRAAVAWSSVPIIWALLLWIPSLAIFGKDLFTTEAPRVAEHLGLYFALLAIEMVFAVWSVVIFLRALGQVHGFSAWRAIGASLIAISIVVIPIFLLAFLLGSFD